MSAAQAAAWRSELASKAQGNASDDLLGTAMGIQLAETVPLVVNRKANGHIGINMYVDDQGSLKNLPLNARATQIAQMCGLMLEVRGDAFIARFFDDDDNFRRLDFALPDLSSSAAWVAEARTFNVEKQKRSGQMKDVLANVTGSPSIPTRPPATTIDEVPRGNPEAAS